MQNDTQVSVVMAVKNETKYITSALESILAQSGVEFEVIVVDDHSTDDTRDQIAALAREHPRLRPMENPRTGKVAAFNTGVAAARGRFVCLFAGDDIMPRGSLAARFDAVKDLPEDRPGTGLFKILTMSEDKRFDGKIIPRAKGRGNPSGQSPLMNRKTIELLFPVPETLPNEDTWLEIAFFHTSQCTIRHSDTICCHWRMHAGNSYNMTLGFKDFKNRIVRRRRAYGLFYEKYKDRLRDSDRDHLARMVKCSEYYEQGRMLSLLGAPRVRTVDKLRMLATINPLFYSIRRTFYGLLSGW